MCGITGIVSPSQRQVIAPMTDAIAHRGPDACGYYRDEHVALGSRRLVLTHNVRNGILLGAQTTFEDERRSALWVGAQLDAAWPLLPFVLWKELECVVSDVEVAFTFPLSGEKKKLCSQLFRF